MTDRSSARRKILHQPWGWKLCGLADEDESPI